MNIQILLGKTTDHLVPLEGTKFFIHKEMIHQFLKLRSEAAKDGFDLQIASAFRDYDRQVRIWNLKASGERQILDDNEVPLEFSKLTPEELAFAIMRWSAIPGCSRHHWGTDIDVYDGNTQVLESVKLVNSETIGNGPSAKFHEWLDSKMSTKSSFDFFRPYSTDRGGVAPERWHLSYAPLSRRYMEIFTSTIFKKNLEESQILLKDVLLDHAHEIYERYFLNVDLP